MARILDEDIAAVRDRANIEDIVGQYLTLRRAGSGKLKGLCPFHDEKSPSFQVNPTLGLFNCFGCNVGGDTITFLQEIEHLDFVGAIERLADTVGITLRYDESGHTDTRPSTPPGQRQRLLAANNAAAHWYKTQLFNNPEAGVARQFLADRGFTKENAEHFFCGYAPDSWDALYTHLHSEGFSNEELLLSGLMSESKRGTPVDRFRGRLIWPLQEVNGDVIGFGARKLLDSDDGPKYLNTPETPVYKKSKVLFGLDKARKSIAKDRRAVVVEGYTDVMACHAAGVDVAVATCGTAFGEDHVRVIRRLLADDNVLHGEVVFTFDGDTAGQKAALRTFELDSQWQTRTYVAVDPEGQDPCEVRQSRGDEAVRALVDNRIPLFEFVLKTKLHEYDLNTAEGKVNALVASVPVLLSVREKALVGEYTARLAGWLGLPIGRVVEAYETAFRKEKQTQRAEARTLANETLLQEQTNPQLPAASSLTLKPQRTLLKLLIQYPTVNVPMIDLITKPMFVHPAYMQVWDAIQKALETGQAKEGRHWVAHVQSFIPDLVSLLHELTVEDLNTGNSSDTTTISIPRMAFRAVYDVLELWIHEEKERLLVVLSNPDLTDEQANEALKENAKIKQLEEQLHSQHNIVQ